MREAWLLLLAGCVTPPARALHAAAPGVVGGDAIVLAGDNYGVGGLTASLRVVDELRVEIGAEARPIALDKPTRWAMGSFGLRLDTWDVELGGWRFTGDVEAGAAAGVGGSPSEECAGPNCVEWFERFAGGGYGGVGFGVLVDWFSVFARGRVQITGGSHDETTLWITGLAGVGVRLWDQLLLSAAAGVVDYEYLSGEPPPEVRRYGLLGEGSIGVEL